MLLYQPESMNKYSTKRSSHCSSFDAYCRHRRDYSPGSKRRSPIRNGSHDEWSPKATSTSYSTSKYSKNRSEKDRDTSSRYDNDRRRTYRTSRTPDRHDSRTSYGRFDSKNSRVNDYHENSNFSSTSAHCSSKKLNEYGDWKEQTSSAGKIYYYNVRTEASQWDKPKEWIEYERRHSKYLSDKYYREKYESDSNYPKSYSYSNDSSRHKEYTSRYDRSPSYRSKRDTEKRSYDDDKRFYEDDRRSYDDDRRLSTERSVKRPRHDTFYKKSEPPCSPLKPTDSQCNIMNNNYNQKYDSRDSDSPKPNNTKSNKTTEYSNSVNDTSLPSSLTSLLSSGQSSQNLSKIISQLKLHGISLSANYTHEELLLILKSLSAKSQSTASGNNVISNSIANNNNSSSTSTTMNSNSSSSNNNHIVNNSMNNCSTSQSKAHTSSPQDISVKREIVHQNSLARNGLNYRNNADGIRQDLDQMSKNLIQSPSSSCTGVSATPVNESKLTRSDSNSLAFNSISSAVNSVPQKATSNLSRFKQFFREDLIQHTTNWQSDQLEEQAWSIFEQVNGIGHRLSKVSMELKKVRSLVRLHEVDITLDKQRILFANQQIKLLEEDQAKATTFS